jgi:hypothetical protein
MTNRQIGERLFLANKTVKNYVSSRPNVRVPRRPAIQDGQMPWRDIALGPSVDHRSVLDRQAPALYGRGLPGAPVGRLPFRHMARSGPVHRVEVVRARGKAELARTFGDRWDRYSQSVKIAWL